MRSSWSVNPSASQNPSAGRGLAGGRLLPDFPEAKTKSCQHRTEPSSVQEIGQMRNSKLAALLASLERATLPTALRKSLGVGDE